VEARFQSLTKPQNFSEVYNYLDQRTIEYTSNILRREAEVERLFFLFPWGLVVKLWSCSNVLALSSSCSSIFSTSRSREKAWKVYTSSMTWLISYLLSWSNSWVCNGSGQSLVFAASHPLHRHKYLLLIHLSAKFGQVDWMESVLIRTSC